MFKYDLNYINLIHLAKVNTNEKKLKITYYWDGRIETQTFADQSEFDTAVDSITSAGLLLIGETYYNKDRLSIVVPNGKNCTFMFIGNVNIAHAYEDVSDVDAVIAEIEPDFIEINGKWYQGKQIHVAKTNDLTLTIDYDYLGMDWFTVTYEDQTAYDAAVEKLANLGNGGNPQPVTPKTSKPTFSPSAGSVEVGTSVTISCADDSATIYYTTDGTTPDTSSSVYSSPIAIPNEGLTIKAVAKAADKDLSAVASAHYTVSMQTVATPTFSPMGGSVAAGSTVIISCDTDGATIYYTTDGSEPDESSTVYADGVTVGTTDFTLKAYAVKADMHDSATASASFTVAMDMVATPVIAPSAGAVNIGTTVTISCATTGAEIHYTTDGTAPSASSPVYSSAITIDEAKTIKAIGIKTGMTNSSVATASYTIAKVATPNFSVPAGEVESGTTVTITCSTSGATIHYTTDGTTPTSSSPTYSTPIEITTATTLKAIAVKANMADSSVKTAEYTIAVVLYRYAGFIVGEDPIGLVQVNQTVLENLDDLQTDTIASAGTTGLLNYTVTHDVDYNSGRPVWAYPSQYGNLTKFKNDLGSFDIGNTYTLKTCTVNGVAYNVYVQTNPLANDEGTVYHIGYVEP